QLDNRALELKLSQLNILKQILIKKEEEKEIEKARKEQLKEEEKVRREIEKAKEKIEKEEKQFNNEMSKMLSYLQKANNDVEKQLYADKIKELEEKIKLLEKDKENVLQRETNTRAGFVYVISNIGAFGENVFKIGMTRRLDPLERISELSSASVPFPFDVHALIFSDDAPSLENALHKHFQSKSVNKVNLRKEFFKIDTQVLKDYILNELGQIIQFEDIPKAEQYRESLAISENITDN
ncbi:MAG: GIY-YIG nuclease family protein, partial [Eubacteriales bacterium]|nr:GIY-YIG nuclease family protein [Eubacteriales bacterium]